MLALRITPWFASVALFLGLAAPASALTNQEAKQELFNRGFSTPAVFPAKLSARLQASDPEVTPYPGDPNYAKGYSVTWKFSDAAGEYRGYMRLARFPKGNNLQKILKSSKQRGFKPRKVKVGKLRVWRVCTHDCGYVWVKSGFFFLVGGFYFDSEGLGLKKETDRDQRAIISSLRKVRDLGIEVPEQSEEELEDDSDYTGDEEYSDDSDY